MDPGFPMHAERTPNPDSIKWVLGRPVTEAGTSAHFEAQPPADVSPLAHRLFDVEGVIRIFLASNFLTVTKREDVEWSDLAEPIVRAIVECLGDGGAALGPAFVAKAAGDEPEVVTRIRRILDEEIRPAVARDGGDVVFAGFREGIVELYMQGACSGCPSATATLRMGIEARLREAVPEVQGVAAL